jgi:hypothetical protein
MEILALRHENAHLRSLVSPQPRPIDCSTPSTLPESPTTPDIVSRRRVLLQAASVAAGALAVGTMLDQRTHEASASHGSDIDANLVLAHRVRVTTDTDTDGVLASTNTEGDISAGVTGINTGTGPGVIGSASNGTGALGMGLIGIMGRSSTPDYGAAYGLHTDNGYGVVGDGHGTTTSGVLGRNTLGEGVRGEGKTGVRGKSPSGTGVVGDGGTGYGGTFRGTRAQVRLSPTARTGKPTTGYHQTGELYLDKTGTLYICTVSGTPGTWRRVSTTTA